jgi:hypothetical protein
MFKYDKYITNSLINVYLRKTGLKKGDNLNANRPHPFIFSSRGHDRQSSDQTFLDEVMIGNHRNKATES